MAKANTTSIQKLRKRAAKKAHKLTKKARKLAMRAAAAAGEPLRKKRQAH